MLAGGKSRRFGRSKVSEPLAGAPMASWGVRALQAVGLPVGVVSDEDGVEAALGVPARSDLEALTSARSAGYGQRFSGPVRGVTMACCFSDATCHW